MEKKYKEKEKIQRERQQQNTKTKKRPDDENMMLFKESVAEAVMMKNEGEGQSSGEISR